MQSYTDIFNFVTALSRQGVSGQLTTLLPLWINESYQRLYNRNVAGWPSCRLTGTFTTTGDQQTYTLPTNFQSLVENSVQYYESTNTTGPYGYLPIIRGVDAELYDEFATQTDPVACTVISGADGLRRYLKLLPNFTNSSRLITYAYYRKPNQSLTTGVVLDVPELASAVAWDVLASNKDFFRDTNDASQAQYVARSEQAYRIALRTTLQ